ncbi:VCBS repeat-containing protein [Stigmatella sp. ncwal1]|uniref:VCBS repeat-containing protein n=1 Tax=Stigmatella ashevillensis TaxID=2995309 RepID=A0ABT5DA13_9BACT|nr:VCBS repeat-containing protein [Stigmatella ashevillena]MDC0709910.1 VCBS repeat-containing protein [Stigmatella ashevillena]
MRRSMWQWLLMGLALWSASGCSCGEPPVESELEVGFEKPVDGQRLVLSDDEDTATDGFQHEVVVRARDTSGRAVKLASAKLEVRTPSEQGWTEGPKALIEGDTARFPAALLQSRTNVLQVTVEEASSRRTATQRISVTVTSEPPSVDLTQPPEGEVLLEADDANPDSPGYQLRFSVNAVGLSGRKGTIYCEQACGVPPTDFTVAGNGATQVEVTLSQFACESQEAQCYAVVRNGDDEVTSGRRHITLDTVSPRVELAWPVAAVASTTFRVEATVGCTEPGVLATLSRVGAPDLSAPVISGGVTFPAVTVPVDGDYLFTLKVSDAGGNVSTRQVPVTVASTTPTLKLVVPKSLSEDPVDGRLDNGVQVPVTVQVDSLPPGTQVTLFTSVTGKFAQPQRAVTNGGREAAFTVQLAGGANAVQACVRNAAGLEQCLAETVTVTTGQPVCRIISPDNGTLIPTTGMNTSVRVESGAGPVTVVALDVNGNERGRSTAVASSGSALVSLLLESDGAYRLLASCPGGATSQLLSLELDSTPPVLAFQVRGVPAGETVLGFGLNDTSLAPGMQVALEVETEPYASVLVTGCALAAGVAGQADDHGALVLRDVSVPLSGECLLQVASTDLAGNTSEQVRALTLAFSPSSLAFETPAIGRYLGATDGIVLPNGGLSVSVTLSVDTQAASKLRLLRGATEIAVVDVAANERTKRFNTVELEEGSNVLRAELIGPGGTVACATVLLLVDTQPGNIALEIPAASPAPVYVVNSDVTPEESGIQAPLKYAANGRSANAVVDICASVAPSQDAAPCRDGSGWYTLAANVPAFTPDFTYPDGRYALRAVLDDGAISVSQSVNITVDSTEPVVRAVELVGDVNGDRRLNAVEWPTGSVQLRVTIDGLEDGRPVQVRNASNPGIVYGQGNAGGGLATVSLDAMPTGIEADYALVVTVTDAAGNQNRVLNPTPFYPLNTAAFFAFRLDRVPPSLVVSAPTRTEFGLADDGSTAVGFQLRAAINTSADVGAGGVRMLLSPGGNPVSLTPSELVATHEFTVPGTGKTEYTLSVVAVDTSGNETSVVRTLTVDLEAPTVTLVAPAASAVYDNTDIPVQVNVAGGDVSTVSILSQVGSAPAAVVGTLPVVSGVAQGTLNFPVGVQTVSAVARDTAGNAGSDSKANVDVKIPGCAITLTTPSEPVATLLAQDDLDPSAAGLQYRLAGITPACNGREVILYKGGSTTPEDAVTADPATGAFFFDVTLADGDQTRLAVEVFNISGLRAVDFVDVTVDITPPLITSISPSPTALFFVASTNAYLFPSPAPDRVVDMSPGGDANAVFTLTVTQGVGSTVQALYKGASVSSEFTISASPETLELPVTLPHNTDGTLEVRVVDASGNTARHTVTATVDVVPPAAPTVTMALVPGQERAAKVQVSWTASGDDGLSGMGVGYDLRWTVNAQLLNGIENEATFFGGKVKQETGALLPATSTAYTLTLPPLARYSIQLRPRDEIGNYAPFAVQPQIDNFWRQVTVTNPGVPSNSYATYITARGDLNADGREDLIVTGVLGNPGSAYVYYGSSDPVGSPPVRQELTVPETGAQAYGSDFDVGDVGNATSEPVADLLVGSRGWTSNSGRAFLYFGRKGQVLDTTAPIEFRHDTAITGATLGGSVKMIQDINGDGLHELLLSSHGETPGKVYLFYSRTPEAWRALGTGCNATSACVVPTSKSDKVFTAPTGMVFFGRSRGYVRLGDITGDGVADFTVPASHERVNNLYVYSGAAVHALGRNVSTTDALQVIHQGPDTTGNSQNGFGTEAFGGVNLVGGAGLDLVASSATQSKVFVFRDGGPSGFPTAPVEIVGGGRFGNALALGDLNGDGRVDIAVGQNVVGQNAAAVFYNQGIPGAEFDLAQENGFWQSKLASTTSLGISLTILDFNGDGKMDLAVGDSQSNPARVVVYY